MSDGFDGDARSPDDVDDVPTVTCSRCDREWDLSYELDELQVGNRAIEQFALDHERHTGHFPDGVSPWVIECQRCPGGEMFLAERPARRWAETHARHTGHAVEITHAERDDASVVAPDDSDG